jgi:hypothetical protein
MGLLNSKLAVSDKDYNKSIMNHFDDRLKSKNPNVKTLDGTLPYHEEIIDYTQIYSEFIS